MSRVMICLVGEQPVPNLLPIYHLNPTHVVLAATNAPQIQNVASRLSELLAPRCKVISCTIEAYNVGAAQSQLKECLKKAKLVPQSILCNITGGTKLMSLAAALLAQEYDVPIFYMASESSPPDLYQYCFKGNSMELVGEPVAIKETLCMSDLLRSFGLKEVQRKGHEPFEKLVLDAVQPVLDEVSPNCDIGENVEVDLIMRIGNDLGVMEIATQKKAHKVKIDQLNAAATRFGSFTRRFLVVCHKIGPPNPQLCKAYKITPIELLNSSTTGLSSADSALLVATIFKEMKRKR